MILWRKKKNIAEQEQEERDDRFLHRQNEPEIEPSIDEPEPEHEHEIEDQSEGVHHVDELDLTPVPAHTPLSDAMEHEEEKERDEEERGGGWLSRLSHGLSRSSRKIGQGLSDLVVKRKLDGATLEQLEELLISADLGPRTAAKVVEDFAQGRFNKEIPEEEIREALAESIANILNPVAKNLTIRKSGDKPFVILVCGVNGVGKTTTIGKLAYNLRKEHTLVLAAGDTFRAAAIEQLQIWAERARSVFVAKEVGADAAAVSFEGYERAATEKADVLMIDTAGRLHTKSALMAELQKIIRVLKKRDESAPHEVLLVLDATTGQNAHAQVETFIDLVNITGLVVTKLDGSAKGGVVVSLADRFGLPIYAVGVGEDIKDLQPFHPVEYARALVGL